MMLLLFFILLGLSTNVLVSHASYLVVSTHDGDNLYVFDAITGDLITDSLLDMSQIDGTISFRGISLFESMLYVANGREDNSFIGQWQCSNSNVNGSTQSDTIRESNTNHNNNINNRNNSKWYDPLLAMSETTQQPSFSNPKLKSMSDLSFSGYYSSYEDSSNPGLVHPYGIINFETSKIENGYMYVSTQDTQSLLLYDSSGKPVTNVNGMTGDYPGAIVTYGAYNTNGNGVRGIEIDNVNGLLFLSQETFNIVFVYDLNNNFKNIYNITNGISTFKPIALEYNSDYFESILFVGDSDSDLVYAFKVSKNGYSLYWQSESNKNLDHPAGLSLSNDILYVISQDKSKIVRYDPYNGNYEKTIVDFKDETGDNLVGELLLYIATNVCF